MIVVTLRPFALINSALRQLLGNTQSLALQTKRGVNICCKSTISVHQHDSSPLTCRNTNISRSKVIMNNNEQMDRLEKNAQLAENIIADIYSKLSELEKSGCSVGTTTSVATPELLNLRQENENLRLEVAKWKELLLLREIRNGGKVVLGNTEDVDKGMKKCVSEGTGLKLNKSEPGMTMTNNKGGKHGGSSKSSAALSRSRSPARIGSGTQQLQPNQVGGKTSKPEVSKKGKGGGNSSSSQPPPPPPAAAGDDQVDVSKLDFRIGLIRACDPHPDADSLYVEKIDLGEGKDRTIISGLVKHVPIEEMRNRLVVVLANLKPAKMRGIFSEGMVMCASGPEKVEILLPPEGSVPGDVVQVDNFPRAPEAVLNPKKKIWETVAPELKTNEKKEATYKGTFLWRVEGKGVVTTSTLTNTMIK